MFDYPKERGVVIKLITLNSKIPNTSWWACFHNLKNMGITNLPFGNIIGFMDSNMLIIMRERFEIMIHSILSIITPS